jgi:hypothetical protein
MPTRFGLNHLAFVGASLAQVLMQTGPLSSDGMAVVVCRAVGGLSDFGWHLHVLDLVGRRRAGIAIEEDSA